MTAVRFADPIAEGQRFADTASRRALHLARFDSADVQLVTDQTLCRRVSELLGPIGDTLRNSNNAPPLFSDVVVVRLGHAGYFVYPLRLSHRAGEFVCDRVIVDRRLSRPFWLCG